MFLVFNKEKINTYLISIGTVSLLLIMGFFVSSNDVVPTMANEQEILNEIESKTKEKVNTIKNNEIIDIQNTVNISENIDKI